jgi:hypothetical protein
MLARPRAMTTIGLVAAAAVLALLVLFVADNFVVVQVRLLRWQVNIRLGWALLIAAASGFVPALILGWVVGRRH